MEIRYIDPIEYPGWDDLIGKKLNGDIFHSTTWAKVLKDTYAFTPVYSVLTEADYPKAIIPLFEVRSLITGKRGVSLPFTDFCNFLTESEALIPTLLDNIFEYGRQNKWKYVEFRSLFFPYEAAASEIFYTHDIDLSASKETIWNSLKDTNRRNIKKAVKEGVQIKFETSLEALNEFYRLQVITRKRHGLPPQPFKFFKAIYENIIAKNLGVIASAYYANKIIASAIYFNFNKEAIFKFGASDEKYHHLRPNNLVMWEAIVWHKDKGCHNLNLGRTEQKNEGLLNYKRLWGSKERLLKYYRYELARNSFIVKNQALANFPVLSSRYFPNFLLKIMGNMLYKHFS